MLLSMIREARPPGELFRFERQLLSLPPRSAMPSFLPPAATMPPARQRCGLGKCAV